MLPETGEVFTASLFFAGKPEKYCSLSAAEERIFIRIIQRIQKVRKFTDISCL